MSTRERLGELWKKLQDPNHYVKVAKVPIFDAHTERFWVDKDGKPCKKDDSDAQEVKRVFSKKELEEIAQVNNQRTRRGDLTVLTFGHTDRAQKDETKQPQPRGYALNYQVGYDPVEKRDILEVDYYIRKEDYPRAQTFPRSSIELWPGDFTLDPIALLRQTPARSIPPWTYHRYDSGREVLRYSKSGGPMAEKMPPLPAEEEEHIDTAGGDDVMPIHQAMHEHAMHCAKGKHYKRIHDHYAKEAMGEEEDPENEAPIGTEINLEEEEPVQNAAAFAAPTGTNAALPAKGKGKVPTAFGKDMERIQMAKVQQQLSAMNSRVAAVEAENNKLRGDRNQLECEAIVRQLVAEGYEFKNKKGEDDSAGEVLRFSKLDEEARAERADWIRTNMQCAPQPPIGPVPEQYGKNGRVDLAPSRGAPPDIDIDPESMDPRDMAAVIQFQKSKGLYDLDKIPGGFHGLVRMALPGKYGKAETNGVAK